jgi:hypothetical protein
MFHKKNNTSTKRNGNVDSHYPTSAVHGFGGVKIFLVCSIQVHPSVWVLVDQAQSALGRLRGLGGGGAHYFTRHDSAQAG